MRAAFDGGVTLLGGGPWQDQDLTRALAHAPTLVCADGGANALAERHPGLTPDLIVGDLDSLSHRAGWDAALGDRLVHIAEQDSTDFDKCMRTVTAPFFIGVGFIGGRIDHELAVFSSILREPRPVLLVADEDVICAAPRSISFEATVGQRVSLFPLLPVRGTSEGLRWPLDGLTLAPGGVIATSNEASAKVVRLGFESRGALLILPKERLASTLRAICDVRKPD